MFHGADRQALATTVEALAVAGVPCERQDVHVPLEWDDRDIATFEGRAAAWFRDPDGNLLQLFARDAVS